MPNEPDDPLDDSVLFETVDVEAGLNPAKTAHASARDKGATRHDTSISQPAEKSGGVLAKLRSLFGSLSRK